MKDRVFDSNVHKILSIGNYFYESIGDFVVYRTQETGFHWEIDCPEFRLCDVLFHECEGKYISLVKPIYPVTIQ